MEKQNDRLLMQVAISLRYMPNGECLHFRYDKLAIRCKGTPNLEHACHRKDLLSTGGLIPDYFDEFGNFNDQGIHVVVRAWEHL